MRCCKHRIFHIASHCYCCETHTQKMLGAEQKRQQQAGEKENSESCWISEEKKKTAFPNGVSRGRVWWFIVVLFRLCHMQVGWCGAYYFNSPLAAVQLSARLIVGDRSATGSHAAAQYSWAAPCMEHGPTGSDRSFASLLHTSTRLSNLGFGFVACSLEILSTKTWPSQMGEPFNNFWLVCFAWASKALYC